MKYLLVISLFLFGCASKFVATGSKKATLVKVEHGMRATELVLVDENKDTCRMIGGYNGRVGRQYLIVSDSTTYKLIKGIKYYRAKLIDL
jgi:hypothetical protein